MQLIITKNFKLATYSKGGPEAEKLALVLPGKLDTKDYPHMRGHVDYLADKGFFALSFDPPATWESAGNIDLYTMTNYLKAINQLIEYFGNRPTFLIGHSRGGSMAMLAGTTNPYVTCFASIMSYYTFNPKIHGEYPDKKWEEEGYHLSERDIPGSNQKNNLSSPMVSSKIKFNMTCWKDSSNQKNQNCSCWASKIYW